MVKYSNVSLIIVDLIEIYYELIIKDDYENGRIYERYRKTNYKGY